MWGHANFVSSTRKSHVGSKGDRRAVSSTENVYKNSNTSIVNNTNGSGGGGGGGMTLIKACQALIKHHELRHYMLKKKMQH